MKKKANFPTTRYNSFFLACKLNQKELIYHLIDLGLDINYKTQKGLTALDVALTHNQIEVLEILLSHGVNVPEKALLDNEKESSFIVKVFDNDNKCALFEKLYKARSESLAFKDEYLFDLIKACLFDICTKPQLFSLALEKLKEKDNYLIKIMEEFEKNANALKTYSLSYASHFIKKNEQLADIFLDSLIKHNVSVKLDNLYDRLMPFVSYPEKITVHLEHIQINDTMNEAVVLSTRLKI